jgi:hypothetical protein
VDRRPLIIGRRPSRFDEHFVALRGIERVELSRVLTCGELGRIVRAPP